MSSRRWLRCFTASALALVSVACSDKSPVEPGSLGEVPPAELVVSDPFFDSRPLGVPAQAGSARPSLISAAGDEVAYVSLPTGSLPGAISVTIRNLMTGGTETRPIPFLNGGFDPVPVVATAGDELELRITAAGGAIILYSVVVPRRRPPGIVRINPPKGATDVPVNSRVAVVFTEPVSAATLTPATVQLLQGTAPVPGTVRPATGSSFVAEFVPDEELASGTTYRLVVTRGILDAEGDSLEAEVSTDFTTVAVIPLASIVAGEYHTCALRADGKVFCWGGNWTGQLGTGTDLLGIGTCPADNPGSFFFCSTVPVTVFGGHTFTSLASGSRHACALTAAGEALCWGWGKDGKDESSSVPLQVGGGFKFRSVVAGNAHTCGIQIGGGAYCWGYEMFGGALGTGDAGLTASPAAVLGGITFTSLASGPMHTCGLTSNGAAYCWGSNQTGELGTGGASPDTCWNGRNTRPCAKAPVLVSGGLTFVSLTAGWLHTCGLAPSGRAYCWGLYHLAGSYGAAPAPVNDDLSFVSLSSGASTDHTCGVTSANVAYCWGNNDSGQLGDGSTKSTLEPVPVTGGLAFSAVAAGRRHSCGMTAADEWYCWGDNTTGQLGIGSLSAGSLRPTRVSGQ